jgi:uncharacterized Zn finger protein (UPF0148 family)
MSSQIIDFSYLFLMSSSSKMGTLLLQGWAMLEECCEDCNVPLMRNRTKDKEICVQCNRDYKADTAAPKVVDQVKAPVATTQANGAQNQADDTLALKRLEEEKQKIL